MPDATGRIFISYAHADRPVAAEITAALQQAGLSPWIDQNEIRPGDSFLERMEAGLRKASYLVLLVSEASGTSRWVRREWMSALAGQETVLIPVKVEPTDMPALLRDIVFFDLTADRSAGIAGLVEFFRRESGPAARPDPTTRTPPGTVTLRGASLRDVRLVANRCLDQAMFKAFLWDEGIDGGALSGDSLHERILGLLHHVNREGLLESFTDWLAKERPRCVATQLASLRQA